LSTTISLPNNQIHLWLAYLDKVGDEKLDATYRALLSDDERRQESRFHFRSDRQRYLITRALVRIVLSKYVPIPPTQWRFKTNAYGRPHVATVLKEVDPPSFSISHAHRIVVVGVAARYALGVDVEHLRSQHISVHIAEDHFAPAEIQALAVLPPDQTTYRFLEYWTLKESYIKACGLGLSIPLDKFLFSFPSDRVVEIEIDRELNDKSARWQLWQFQPTPEYLVAICAERDPHFAPTLVVKTIVPTRTEELLVPEILRQSK
jgi:4'-phosphopantetheinyl transferase